MHHAGKQTSRRRVNFKENRLTKTRSFFSLLAQSGHSSIVEMLIKAGCELNSVDKNKWTPLMNACYWANEEAVISLVEAGSDVNLRNIVSFD